MPRSLAALAPALLLVAGLLTSISPTTADAATSRPAESAGSAAIGSASYAVPSGAVFASPTGNDSAAGSQSAPVKTITRALALVATGGTVVLRGGSYNETVVISKKVTVQNFPGEAVWLDGTTPVTNWVKDGSLWRKDGWTTRFDHSPSFTKGGTDSGSGDWKMVDSSYPMAAYPDQVWVGSTRLQQVSTKTQVTAGTFYLDESTSKLYVGSDPSAGAVASNLQYAINVRAENVTVRGIGARRFATSVWQMGSITLERAGAALENVVVKESATTGISSLGSGITLTKVTSQDNGMLGIHGNNADNIKLTGVLVKNNNTEKFNVGPVAGGLKFTKSRGITVTESSFVDNNGHGFWEDQSSYNSIFVGNDFSRNTGYGLFLEISAKALVVDSRIMNNKRDGILINNFSNVQVWNNTIIGNARPLWLAQDSRRNNNKSSSDVDQRIAWPDPEIPFELDYVTVGNNVIGNPASGSSLLDVEDYTYTETAEQMHIVTNGNVYTRANASSPSWLSIWSKGKAGGPYTFTTLAAMKSATGQESRSREYTGSSVVDSSGALASSVSSLASSVALPLPTAVASAIGRPTGTTALGAWISSSSTSVPTPTPTPTATPTTTPTSTPTQTPTGATVLANDAFTRTLSSGWGSADTGGAWTIPSSSGQFGVGNGVSRVQLTAGEGLDATLSGVSSTSSDSRIYTALDRAITGGSQYISLVGRDVGTSDYQVKIRIEPSGQVTAWLVRTVSGVQTVIAQATPNVVWAPTKTLVLRLQVTGTSPTTVQAKVWPAEQAEPSGWTVSATDNTSALQTAGAVGIWAYASSSMTSSPITVFFDDFKVTRA